MVKRAMINALLLLAFLFVPVGVAAPTQPPNIRRLFESYRPHSKQVPFHKSKARFKALAAGTRGGKTYAAAREFMRKVYRGRTKKQGRLNYWIIAPDYSLTEVAREELADILGCENPEDMKSSPLVKKWNASKLRLWLHGNILIEFKSAERPEKLVARGLDGAWFDEASRCPQVAWANLRARLADRQGWCIFSTTPMGKNWFYNEVYRLGDSLDEICDPEFESFLFKTADNTAVPGLAAEVERARKQMPARYFKRDFEASFEIFSGQVYDEFDREIHIVGPRNKLGITELPETFAEVIATKDWGYRPNPGVTLVIGITGGGDWYVIDEIYETGLLITPANDQDKNDTWVKWDKELKESYDIREWYADPSEPAYIEAYRKNGIYIQETKNDVAPGIQAVAVLLHINEETGRPRLFISPKCKNLIRELESYHYKENRDGTLKEGPEKKDDHCPDALRYAIFTKLGKPKFDPAAMAILRGVKIYG